MKSHKLSEKKEEKYLEVYYTYKNKHLAKNPKQISRKETKKSKKKAIQEQKV